MNKLCGISIAKDCVKYDYCIRESIISMLGVCDYVICAYVHSTDGTIDILESIENEAPNFKIIRLTVVDWNFYNDKHRLSYITNIAISEADRMGFQYVLSVQADEVLHEESYTPILMALEQNNEAYLVHRINLWKTPEYQLNVPQERKPCSTEVIRLAKSSYRAFDDAESIAAPVHSLLNDVVIVHYGFVRKKEVMKDKIINMQEGVFSMNSHDVKLDTCEIFNPDLWFNPETDLIPIQISHPVIMEDWVAERL